MPTSENAEAGTDRDATTPRDAGDDAPPLYCSTAGWCETRFPEDAEYFVDDLWPLEGTAFAAHNGIAQYDGTKWISLYDETIFTSIWAPNANEVWAGDYMGAVTHGTRSAGTWTWSTETVASPTEPEQVTSIWGSGPDDVYVATETKLYHRTAGNGGASTWSVDYQDNVPPNIFNNDGFRIWQITGSGADDVWLLASRGWGNCSTLIHKSKGQFTTLADCRTSCSFDTWTCDIVPVPSIPVMPDAFTHSGFLLQPGTLLSTNAGELFVANPSMQRVRLLPSGETEINRTPISGAAGISLWGLSETDLYSAGWTMLTHSSNALTGAGTFAISTLVLNGAPLVYNFKVRGTSASDIWVFGGPYALHKTAR
ncbi:hypothetical protein AKJ09_01995 [Labilithrix luteola]|uniref:Type IV fimbrial biogenesis protein PilY1 n=1 Tax=Labilithrix luteola TaxID=1391654 RepID=A0A0K1PPM5_9BACT|nr:hypothetical protein AKJ09_01995 [Labilithrix luteola]